MHGVEGAAGPNPGPPGLPPSAWDMNDPQKRTRR
jgi:hypothetical protein